MARLGEGRIPAAKEDLERSLALYSPERDAASTHMFGQNTEVHSQALLSLTLFCAGDVNQRFKLAAMRWQRLMPFIILIQPRSRCVMWAGGLRTM